MIKKFSKKIAAGIVSAQMLVFKVFAQDASSTGSSFRIPNPTIYNNLFDVISALAKLIVPVFLITFAAMLLYGAFQWLTARDDAAKVESAKKIMVAAIIGFILAVIAPTIVNFVASLLGVQQLQLSGQP